MNDNEAIRVQHAARLLGPFDQGFTMLAKDLTGAPSAAFHDPRLHTKLVLIQFTDGSVIRYSRASDMIHITEDLARASKENKEKETK